MKTTEITPQEFINYFTNGNDYKIYLDCYIEKPYLFISRAMYNKTVVKTEDNTIIFCKPDRFKTHIATIPIERVSDISQCTYDNDKIITFFYKLDNLVTCQLTLEIK